MCRSTCRRKHKKQLLYLHEIFDRRPKEVRIGDVYIMMFYGRPKKVSLTHSIEFITITFLKYNFSVPPENINN